MEVHPSPLSSGQPVPVHSVSSTSTPSGNSTTTVANSNFDSLASTAGDLSSHSFSSLPPHPGPALTGTPPDVHRADPVKLTIEQRTAEIERIKGLITAPAEPNKTTQSTLKEIVDELNALGYDVEIESKLNGDPKPKVEAFSLRSFPNDTYYKIGVEYQLKVIAKAGTMPDHVDLPPMPREIYTSATLPETAIHAAYQYKETMAKLALGKLDDSMKGSEAEVLKQGSFKFKFEYGEEGKPTKLHSIWATDKGKKEVAVKFKQKSQDKEEYRYYRDPSTREVKRVKKDEQDTISERLFYSAEEALASAIEVVDADPYSRLEQSENQQKIDEQLKAIKDRVQKEEIQLSELKKAFVQPAGRFSKENEDPGFSQIKSLIKQVQAKKSELPALDVKFEEESTRLTEQLEKLQQMKIDPTATLKAEVGPIMDEIAKENPDNDILHPGAFAPEEMIPLLSKGEKLDECIRLLEEKKVALEQNYSKEKKELSDAIPQMEKNLGAEVKKYRENYSKFQQANLVLKRELEMMQKLKAGAEAKVAVAPATEEDKKKHEIAEYVVKNIPSTGIDALQAKVASNDRLIAEIEGTLHF